MALLFGVGFGTGVLVAILTVLAEHSRIAFGSYALFGNGALIVPSLCSSYALFLGWTFALRRGARALELALFAAGLHLGIGTIPVLEVLFFASSADLTLLDALPGFLLTGAIFVDPAALLAGLALWWTRRSRGLRLQAIVFVAIVASAILGFAFGIGLGVLAGTAVAIAERWPARTAQIAIVLAALVLVLGNLPYLTQTAQQ